MAEKDMRLLYLGLRGPFSRAPLAALLAANRQVVAVVVPAAAPNVEAPIQLLQPAPARSELPLVTPYLEADTVHVAWARAGN